MLILAFESSAKASSVALVEDGRLLGESYLNTGLTHSQTLLPQAQQVLASAGKQVSDLSAVAVAMGPGSFTGVRIGVAAAKGLAWGAKIPCFGVSTLEAMALSLGIWKGTVCCAMDARRSQVYNALFEAREGKLRRLTPDRAISLEELEADLQALSGPVFLVGDGSWLCRQRLTAETVLLPEHRCHQRAVGVALGAQRAYEAGERPDGASLVPNYLRLSQAERERLARENDKDNKGV